MNLVREKLVSYSMRYLRRRRPFNQYLSNPDTWEGSVRTLLKKLTGAGWRRGQPPPPEWHVPYVSEHPEWTAIWLVSSALSTTPEELLKRIRPGRPVARDVDELSILYEFIKEYLITHRSIRGRDVDKLSVELGLTTLSGQDRAKERTRLLKQLVKDGYATQHMGRFRGSSYYIPTEKLLEEVSKRPTAVREITEEVAIEPAIGPVIEPEEAVIEPETITPLRDEPAIFVKPGTSVKPKDDLTKKIVLIGGQSGACPDGKTSLRPIKQKECAWLDKNFRWTTIPSYGSETFTQKRLPLEADLVILFTKYMKHSQSDMAFDFYQTQQIPILNNIKGNALGSLQMAAEAAKTHGPQWFADAYDTYLATKRRRPRKRI